MATPRPNLHVPGMVMPDGSLSKPLRDLVAALLDGTNSTSTAVTDLTALTARVDSLEDDSGSSMLVGRNGINVFDDGTSTEVRFAGTTDNVPEGANLYYTDARAQAACVTDDLQPDVTDVAPSQDAVLRAIVGRQPLDAQLTGLAGLTYGSNALKVVRVNAGETGWELATVSGGGSTPTGTGLYGVTGGVMDAAAVTIGSGLSLSAGTLSATGGGGISIGLALQLPTIPTLL